MTSAASGSTPYQPIMTVSPTPMAMRARWLPISGRPSDSVAMTWGR